MKTRVFAFLSALFIFGVSLSAAPVSPGRALDIARKIFAAQPATKAGGGALRIVWDGEEVATKSVQPAFYVVARDGGGFVIVAGDDNVRPILAISDHNEFKVEDMPENVKWWMDRMKAFVRSAKVQSPEARAQWAKFAGTKAGSAITGTVTVISEHLTPEWDQCGTLSGRLVYNSKCPVVDGEYTLTGCGATAVAELMTTLSGIYPSETPTHGEGTVAPYEPKEGHVSASTPEHPYVLGADYDWAGLRSLTGKEAIMKALENGQDDLVDNMDQLLADVGAAINSQYSVYSTASDEVGTIGRMVKYFGFNKNAYMSFASDHTARQWAEKLKGELDVRPLLYCGYTKEGKIGGHAFVLDAYGQYEGADVFHVNFGWSGYYNAYYPVTDLDIGVPGYIFSWDCCAFFDFYPDPSSTYRSNIKLIPVDDDTPFGFSYAGSAPVAKGDLLLLDWFRISNRGNEAFDGKLRVVALNQNGDVLQVFDESDRKDSPLPPRTNFDWCFSEEDDIHILFDISLGDRIVLQYPVDDENTLWQKVEGSVTAGNFIDELPLIPLAFIRTEDSYKVGDWFDLRLMNHDRIYAGTKWTFTDPDGKVVTIDQSEREFQLTKKGIWMIEAAVSSEVGADPVKTLTTYIEVK
jgi:hypothetical protein